MAQIFEGQSTMVCKFVSMLGLLLLSLNVTAWLIARPLEIWYDEDPLPHTNADAIVSF